MLGVPKYSVLTLLLLVLSIDTQWLHEPLSVFNGTVTFDGLAGYPGSVIMSAWYKITTLVSTSFQEVSYGVGNCVLFWGGTPAARLWLSNHTWPTIPEEAPGFFGGISQDTTCPGNFKYPISALSMQIYSSAANASLVVLDTNGKAIDAISIPQLNNPSNNTFVFLGYTSETLLLGGFQFNRTESLIMFDNIRWRQCATNQRLRDNTCEDLCGAATVLCSSHASCNSSLKCQCNRGFEGNGFTCTDIDECSRNSTSCGLQAHCNNTIGSYLCTCDQGYESDGYNCHDIDECLSTPTPCSSNAYCNNTDGAFQCTCNQGYEGDGHDCHDIDECSLATSPCSTNGYCNNTDGSFTCTCQQGYEGDGLGVDGCREIVPPITNNPLPSITPINIDNHPVTAPKSTEESSGVSSGNRVFGHYVSGSVIIGLISVLVAL